MKKELNISLCPECGKEMREHYMSIFDGAKERELAEIELYRDLPKDGFKKWLLDKRIFYTNEIHKLLKDMRPESLVNINRPHLAYSILNVWNDYIDLYDQEIKNLTSTKRDKKYISTLKEACRSLKEYESIKAWFINEGLCDPVTFVWTGNKKVTGKTALANYIKDLHPKKYTQKLANSEIRAIIKNDFNFNIAVVTIKNAKGNPNHFPQIPPFVQ